MTDVAFELAGRVAVIRIHGSRLNVYRRATHERLCRAMLRFLRDDSLHAAVITTPEGQSWSAGDDIKEFDQPWGDEPDWSEVLLCTPRDKPVVAAVRDYCLGQGLVYLLRLTDIRFATPGAQFGFPEIRFGVGGAAETTGLSGEIPATVARFLGLTGDLLNAEQAASVHLVNGVVEGAELEATAVETARRIAAHPLHGLRAEMSPAARIQGGRDPFAQVAQFQATWHAFQLRSAGSDLNDLGERDA